MNKIGGKKFSSTYQPPEKWTEKKALELGEELIEWLNEIDENGDDVGNTLYEEFLIINKGLYNEILSYLGKKFPSFLKLLERAKKIQEIKLHKYGLADRLNASIVKFSLINNHGWKDKQEIDRININEVPIKIIVDKDTADELEKLNNNLNENE